MPYAREAVADLGPDTISVYVEYRQRMKLLTQIPILYKRDEPTRLLQSYGWARISSWSQSDDMPTDHYVAALKRWAP